MFLTFVFKLKVNISNSVIFLPCMLFFLIPKMETRTKDTIQHGGECELHRAGIRAAFEKLFPQVHKWKETLW